MHNPREFDVVTRQTRLPVDIAPGREYVESLRDTAEAALADPKGWVVLLEISCLPKDCPEDCAEDCATPP